MDDLMDEEKKAFKISTNIELNFIKFEIEHPIQFHPLLFSWFRKRKEKASKLHLVME